MIDGHEREEGKEVGERFGITIIEPLKIKGPGGFLWVCEVHELEQRTCPMQSCFVIHGLPMWRVDDSGRVYAHTPIRSM